MPCSFRFGLSYTTFQLSDLEVLPLITTEADRFEVHLRVHVANTGSLPGSETVQAYISLPTSSHLTHPVRQLRAFRKVKDVPAGMSTSVVLALDKCAVSYWDDRRDEWVVESGVYGVWVGTSSAEEDLVLKGTFEVKKGFSWSGL